VLEARDRVGGRVWTDRSDGYVTDRGRRGSTGSRTAPSAAATAFGMPTVEFTVGGYQPDSRPIAHYSRKASAHDADAARYVADIHAADAALVASSRHPRPTRPTATSPRPRSPRSRPTGVDGDRAQRVREYLEHRSEEQYGAAIDDLAAHGLDDDQIDGDEVVFPGATTPSRGARRGPRRALAHVVSRVEWEAGGVVVTTDRGAFAADDAIVTVPVGVLQSEAFEIAPALPEPVAGALSRLG
jgi:monoamine oxidase